MKEFGMIQCFMPRCTYARISPARERFFHFHGEKTPRLNNDQSVYGHNPKRSYFITVLSPLLFNAPLRHLRAMEIVNMDQHINQSSWYQLISTLRTEWQELVLYVRVYKNFPIFPTK
jgi:hypothetical protein